MIIGAAGTPHTTGCSLIVTGLKQEARIAAGPGLTVICSSSNPVQLREMMTSFDPASIRGIVSFGVAGGLNPSLKSGDVVVASHIVTGETALVDRGVADGKSRGVADEAPPLDRFGRPLRVSKRL